MSKSRQLLRDSLPEIIGGVLAPIFAVLLQPLLPEFTWGSSLAFLALVAFLLLIVGLAYIAFIRDPSPFVRGRRVWRYPRARRWALVFLGAIMVGMILGGGYYLYDQGQPPDKVIVLVADFPGPKQESYCVTDVVLASLGQTLEEYPEVQVQALRQSITEAEGSAIARREGEKRKATIVIWGWYGVTTEKVTLSVHFEMIRPPQDMPRLGRELRGWPRSTGIAEIESFELQSELSEEMAYITLFTAGMANFSTRDWEKATDCFEGALNQPSETVRGLDQSIIYAYHGMAQVFMGKYDQAIADCDRALELNPELALAHKNRGAAYVGKGEHFQAMLDLKEAVRIDPDLALAYNNQAVIHALEGEYDQAISKCNHALDIDPDLPYALINRGVAYFNKGEHEYAMSDLDRVVELRPDWPESYYIRAAIHSARGNTRRAIADSNRAVKLRPDLPIAYAVRAAAHVQGEEYDNAVADADRAIELLPEEPCDYCYEERSGLVMAHNYRALAYLGRGEYDQAIADSSLAIDHWTGLHRNEPTSYLIRATAYFRKGEYDLALGDCNSGMKMLPHQYDGYWLRGAIYVKKGEYDLAITDCNHAIALQPDESAAYLVCASAYSEKEKLVPTVANLAKAYKLLYGGWCLGAVAGFLVSMAVGIPLLKRVTCDWKGSRTAKRCRALVRRLIKGLLSLLRPGQLWARRVIETIRDLVHDRRVHRVLRLLLFAAVATGIYLAYSSGRIHYIKALSHALHHDWESAQRNYTRAIQLDPNNAQYRNGLCWHGSVLGHANEVLDACERAVQLAPNDGRIRDSRGVALALVGDYEGAVEDFEYFVEWSKEYGLYEQQGSRREAWILELEAGRDPFDEATLEALMSE